MTTSDALPLGDLLAALNDIEFPGGCESCEAFQTVQTLRQGIHVMAVHHEDACPFWLSVQHLYPPTFD